MTRILRILLAASAVALAVLGATSASAGSVTLSDPNCDSFMLSVPLLGSQTLTCVISNPPTCTVQGPSAGSIGSQITLTAQCSPAATTWFWTGGDCASKTAQQCSPNESVAGPVNYTVRGTNANGPGAVSNPLAVNWTSGPPPMPTGCSASITPNPNPLTPLGGTATVSVTGCQPAGVTYNWTKNVTSGWSTSATPAADTLAAGGTAGYTNSYRVNVCNGSSCNDWPVSGPLTAFVPGSGGGGGGAVDLSACVSQGFTNAAYYDTAYPVTGIPFVNFVFSQAIPNNGLFGNNSALVIRFTTPALGVNDTTQPNFSPEPALGTATRQLTIGTAPCLIPTFNSTTLPVVKTSISQSPAFSILINAGGLCPDIGTVNEWRCASTVYLKPNTPYFMTLVNKSGFTVGNSCPTSNCDMRFDFNN